MKIPTRRRKKLKSELKK